MTGVDAPGLLSRRRAAQTALAALAYVALTVVMTWPIARGAGRDVPADLGDSLLNMWIMGWVSEGLLAMAHGSLSFADLWNANIFHPTPLALTLSEHLVPQAVQGLPAYLATGNILLAYDLVFLSTFVLSGLGMFLFVREITGDARAAFVAGLFYAFLPYRLGVFPHIQTLSSQWMPFALLGLRRFFDHRSWRALAWGTAAFVVQSLSSGYYLFYFAPVLLLYAVWEITARGRAAELRTWAALGLAGVAATVATLPFLLPYAEAKSRLGLTRPYVEVVAFSANLFAYLNAPPQLLFWGPLLNGHPQPEGDIFFGAVPIVLALAAPLMWLARVWRAPGGTALSPRRRAIARGLGWIAVAGAAVGALIFATGGLLWEAGPLVLKATSPSRPLKLGALAGLAWLVVSPRAREAIRSRATDLTPFLMIACLFAIWMSLGPEPHLGDRRLGDIGPYMAFFDLVPGFDGLRVPARFGMVAACLLAPLGGIALAALMRRRPWGPVAAWCLGVLFLGEAYAAPIPTNLSWRSSERYADPWDHVSTLNSGPLAYRYLIGMPAETVVLELPLGEASWDLRYVYYAGLHGKRIVNGYSGYYPAGYGERTARLAKFGEEPEEAWAAVLSSGATHLLLHEDAYLAGEWRFVAAWIERHGGRLAVQFDDGARLYAVPRP